MMDRHASLSAVQVSFVDGVCTDIYQVNAGIHLHVISTYVKPPLNEQQKLGLFFPSDPKREGSS
jgi:hypothetical protein